jgi:hypothetical protein
MFLEFLQMLWTKLLFGLLELHKYEYKDKRSLLLIKDAEDKNRSKLFFDTTISFSNCDI